MALTESDRPIATPHPGLAGSVAEWRERLFRMTGLAYGLVGVATTWAFWTTFVVFLSNAPKRRAPWINPTVDVGPTMESPFVAAVIDLALIALFGLQHSLMARPRLKKWWASAIVPAFERATYVHAANAVLFALVRLWQPIPIMFWHIDTPLLQNALWMLFALGWITLLAGGLSFGIHDLLGLRQIWSWYDGRPLEPLRLKTYWLYEWLRHPMYVGVLLGVWATPHMTAGHALLGVGFTLYVLIAMRYEERDLAQSFGAAYRQWRSL